MHRNTFVNAPRVLDESLRVRTLLTKRDTPVWLAGQITGSEGYVGSALTGLVAGLNAVCYLRGLPPLEFPYTTMTGALLHYLTHADPHHFQPMKANFGLLPPLERPPRRKRDRYLVLAQRALRDLEPVLQAIAHLRTSSE
jgi:methylenetetrahydrofolate--tRNA-(uracil-5-)-methyltransferase